MHQKVCFILLMVILLLAGVQRAHPQKLPRSGTFEGHVYQLHEYPGEGFVSMQAYWNRVRELVDSLMPPAGHRKRYLAVVRNKGENRFVLSLIPDGWGDGILLGAYRAGEVWRWVNGEPWDYASWGHGKPNNYGGNERYLNLWGRKPRMEVRTTARWNDMGEGTHMESFPVEWEPEDATTPKPLPSLLVVTFEADGADRNDFGSTKPLDSKAWRTTPAGRGSPSHPEGHTLDAGLTDPAGAPVLAFPLPHDADLRQGTLELWFQPGWDMGDRRVRTLADIKLRGGYWNGIWLGYHGTIGADTESFGMNVMDGIDHPAYVHDARKNLSWKAGEWHHIAATWTGHAVFVFVDGKLVAQTFSDLPLRIGENEGQVRVGGGWGDTTPSAGGLIDEFRLVNLPLYSPQNPPNPRLRVTEPLQLGKAWRGNGARATADSTAAPQTPSHPLPALNNGQYGDSVVVPDVLQVTLAQEREVQALEWSYDGTPYAGEGGRGWAPALPYPRAFRVEVSLDGNEWRTVVDEQDFRVTPELVARQQALRFRFPFSPQRARYVRMTILQKASGGTDLLRLDEIAVYGTDGANLAREQGAAVLAAHGQSIAFSPELAIDGRWGDTSCWKSATPGRGVLTVELPEATEIQQVFFSRSRDGIRQDGTPSAGYVEVSADGQTWQRVGEFRAAQPTGQTVQFTPCRARWVRLVVTETVDGKEVVVDDLRVD